MRILAFVGSPRRKGNTDVLVDQLLDGAKGAGHVSRKIHLYQHAIGPCIDCRRCKKGDCVCILEDGMQDIYPKIDAADLLVFGTPNYWYGPTGKMKLFVDRLRPYVATGRLRGKKGILVVPAAEGPEACGPMTEMFRRSMAYLGMVWAGEVLGTAYDRGEIRKDEGAMSRARDLGASL
jgi:multimeric flavodoxin WrbA